ncbi:MAG: M10 family metallopeptidase C-terminal domain-containing protein, partial [Planctomycetota bacterium]
VQNVHTNRTIRLNSVSTFENAIGGSGNDSLTGNALANVLTGNAGNDNFSGLAGNDTYVMTPAVTAEADSLSESSGAGTDTIDFSLLTTGVTFNLGSALVQNVHTNRTIRLNSVSTFENAIGGSGNDSLTGNALANVLTGNAGNDLFNGLAGSDTLTGGAGDDVYQMSAAVGWEFDTLAEDSSPGTDTIDFSSLTSGVTLNLGSAANQYIHTNRTIRLSSASTFENVVGGSGNDSLTGNALANVLTGNAGNDTLSGAAGNDALIGGLGNDNYVFTAAAQPELDSITEAPVEGIDSILMSSITTSIVVDLSLTTVQPIHLNRSLRLSSGIAIENLTTGTGHDSLTGNELANTLNGGAGNDILSGLAGNDTLAGGAGDDVYRMRPAVGTEVDSLSESIGSGMDTIDFSSLSTGITFALNTTAVQNVHLNRSLKLNSATAFENVAGGSANDILTGNSASNILVGNGGNDTLRGNDNRDILIGGTGSDSLNGGWSDDILIAGTTAYDQVFSDLNQLLTVWKRLDTYSTRVSRLRTGIGSPAISLKAKQTVLGDHPDVDNLTGDLGYDWYFAGVDDVISGRLLAEDLDLL